MCIQSSHELSAYGDEESVGGLKVAGSCPAQDHRSDEGHSESVKISSIQGTIQEFSKKIMKAGIMEEVVDDMFESMDGLEEMEEAAKVGLIKFCLKLQQGPLAKHLVM